MLMNRFKRSFSQSHWLVMLSALFCLLHGLNAWAQTPLADRPVYSGTVTGNVALALSVEWPTGITSSYKSDSNYQKNKTYLGYFDSEKCYAYNSGIQTIFPGLYNTGVDDSNKRIGPNKQDPHWTIIDYAPGASGNLHLLDDTSNHATSTARQIGWATGRATNLPLGEYEWESDLFTFPANVNPRDVKVTFSLYKDDQLRDIKINGVSTGISSNTSWDATVQITIPKGSFSGQSNRISLVVYNGHGPTGIMIDNMEVTVDNGDYGNYFKPVALASNHSCRSSIDGRWSGNFLNWSLTQVIDPFRHALTGGNRYVDEVGKTILEKAYGSTQGNNGLAVDRVLNSNAQIRDATPFDAWSYFKLRIHGLGNKFYLTGSSGQDLYSPGSVIDGSGIGTNPDANQVYEFLGRVEVCVPGLLEDNCHAYPNGSYKPIGLIQTNAEKLRFSAFGYLNDHDIMHDGGVLRARMSSINPGGDFPEWDANTGIFIENPNPAYASASGVTNSGVINYLNKFGLIAPGYKSKDPVSELYYSVGRYFRNKGNVAEYTALTGNATTDAIQKDGFPVISNWGDPIKNTCDLNFIIGIGDTNAHADANLPGSTIRTSKEPSQPSAVSNDYGSLFDTATHYTDVYTSTKRVGDLEGISNLQTSRPPCCGTNSFFISGLAYDLHTRDIRPSLAGKQTVSTYWLDVLESGFINKNQYWLAAKYGGFDVEEDYEPYGSTLSPLANSTWDADNDGDPDHYYRADDPGNMVNGLSQAFDSILSIVDKVTTGFALSNPNVLVGDKSYSASYTSSFWSGKVIGNSLTFDNAGNPVETEVWNTDTVFAAQVSGTGWDSQRKVVTSNCVPSGTYGEKQCTGVPFRYGTLNAANSLYLNQVSVYTGVGQEVLNYLRGDRSLENKYRKRSKILGDIVHSRIAAVDVPNAPYSDGYNPGYSAFKAAHANRQTVVYVGANDGMLHAFDGDTGTEKFAYVPQALFKGHDNDTLSNGLVALADPGYKHRFYVDASPSFYDVNFGGGAGDWHTLLLGGLGKGGKSYYALDITNPAGVTSEATAAANVQWEFSHRDLGFTYGRPIAVKVDGKWVVIFTSGYNNQDGKGYFFIVDPKTGALINKVSTGVGSTTNDAGLAHLTAYVADGKDFSADAVYAGDLLGNLWRLDLDGIASAGYAKLPQLIATLKSPNGDAQPITTSPIVELDQTTKERFVFVGTGRLLDETDLPSTQINSIYAMKDGDQASFYTASTLPSPVSSFPINPRSVMVNHTDEPGAVTLDSNKPMGYYIDMPSGFYIDAPMTSSAGVFAAFANKIIGDSCKRDSLFRGYVLEYASGESLISNTNTGITTQYVEGTGQASSVTIYKQPNSAGMSVNFSHDSEDDGNTSIEISKTSYLFKILNWRLVPIE